MTRDSRRLAGCLAHILEPLERIGRCAGDMDEAAFLDKPLAQDAVIRKSARAFGIDLAAPRVSAMYIHLQRRDVVRAELQKWGNSAAVRVPAPALEDAGMQIGQSLELRVEEGRLVIEPAAENLEDLLGRMTPENRHGPALEGPAVGAEVW